MQAGVGGKVVSEGNKSTGLLLQTVIWSFFEEKSERSPVLAICSLHTSSECGKREAAPIIGTIP